MSVNIGFIGLGLMGGHMAMNLLKAGHRLYGYDLVAERLQPLKEAGGQIVSSIEELADHSNISVLSLPNLQSVQTVVDELLKHVRSGHMIINTSTVSTAVVQQIEASCKERGVIYFDCPVSGGVTGAEAGTLSIIVGGDEQHMEHIKPLLSCMGTHIFYVGSNGKASMFKLVNQLMFFSSVLILSEAVFMADRAGLDRNTLMEIVSRSSGNSYALQTRMKQKIIPASFDPGASVSLAYKDIELLLEEAERLGINLPIGSMLRKRLAAAKELGISDRDLSIMAAYYGEPLKDEPNLNADLPAKGEV